MIAVLRIARADLRERSRTTAFLLVLAAALEVGYLFVPDARARYVTVDLDGYRGIYDGAWMGAMTALLCVSLGPLLGFFLVRGALMRDARLGFGDVLAATPASMRAVAIAKWASNCAVLFVVCAAVLVAAVAMQYVRAEDTHLDPIGYLVPFALATVPACMLTAAVAIAFDAIRPLRGVVGGIVAFALWNACIIVPMTAQQAHAPLVVDPLGLTTILTPMVDQLRALHANVHVENVSIGATLDVAAQRTYRFTGIPLTPGGIAVRLAWAAGAVAIALLGAVFADRRAAVPRGAARRRRIPFERIVPPLPFARLARAEFLASARGASTWWWVVFAAAALVAGCIPEAAAARFVLPLALVWPIARWAEASVRDRANAMGAIVGATPHAAWRPLIARFAAGAAFGVLAVGPFALRELATGHALTAVALFGALCVPAALALACGALFGNARFFEALGIIVWYLGAVNGTPILDVVADARTAPGWTIVVSVVLVCASLASTVALRRRCA